MKTTALPASAPAPLRLAGLLACAAASLPLVHAAAAGGLDPRLAAGLAAFAVFGAAFAVATSDRVMLAQRPRALWALVGLQSAAALAAVHAVPALATLVLTVVVATQLPRLVALPVAALWIALLTAAAASALRYEHVAAAFVVAGIFGAFQLFAFATAVIAQRERQARAELAVAHANLRSAHAVLDARARQGERERLTAELHDLLGHDLVALKLNLAAARRDAPAEATRDDLARCEEIASRVLDDVRGLVRARRAGGGLDLAQAARDVARDIPAPRVLVDAPESLVVGHAEVAEAALRCVQEAVTNAVRHSGAREVRVVLRREPSSLVVEVSDDGRGAAADGPRGGLAGLEERARRLGGKLRVSAEGGFRVTMELPCPEAA